MNQVTVNRIQSVLPHMADAQAQDLAAVVDRLVAALHPDRIYVFGSQVRGEATVDSDIDLMVVVPVAKEETYRLEQVAYAAAWPYAIALDILVLARDEFERRSRARSSLPATVLREGQTLYAA